jgi:sterol 3beta-glucosyltransferase
MLSATEPIRLGRLVQALQLTSQRGIILGSSAAERSTYPANDIYCASEIPYWWLFPRVRCVIHHGGTGTIAAAVAAGVTSIVLPQIPAQRRIAHVLFNEGLASGVFDSEELDVKTMCLAIQRAVSDQRFKERARGWQMVIAQDRGVRAAADMIEAHYQRLQ